MRNLNMKQKKLLDTISNTSHGLLFWGNLTAHEQLLLEKLNNMENLQQEVDRYLSDAYFKKRLKKDLTNCD